MPRRAPYTAEDVLSDLRDWHTTIPEKSGRCTAADSFLAARIHSFFHSRTPEERVTIARLAADLANAISGMGPVSAFEAIDYCIRAGRRNGRES